MPSPLKSAGDVLRGLARLKGILDIATCAEEPSPSKSHCLLPLLVHQGVSTGVRSEVAGVKALSSGRAPRPQRCMRGESLIAERGGEAVGERRAGEGRGGRGRGGTGRRGRTQKILQKRSDLGGSEGTTNIDENKHHRGGMDRAQERSVAI